MRCLEEYKKQWRPKQGKSEWQKQKNNRSKKICRRMENMR